MLYRQVQVQKNIISVDQNLKKKIKIKMKFLEDFTKLYCVTYDYSPKCQIFYIGENVLHRAQKMIAFIF